MPLPPFDPADCAVIVEIEPRSLEVSFPEDALMHSNAHALRLDAEGEPLLDQVYGSLGWTQVGYSFALDAQRPLVEVADHHHDLLHLHESLFDEEGTLRKKYGDFSGFGNDLLLIDGIHVVDGQDFERVAGALLKHVLTLFSGGCFAAAYIDDPEPNPQLHKILREAGFRWYQEDGWGFFLLDLGRQTGGRKQNRRANLLVQ